MKDGENGSMDAFIAVEKVFGDSCPHQTGESLSYYIK